MGQTISDWIIALQESGHDKQAQALQSNKLEDARRIQNAGLPALMGIKIPYTEFSLSNSEIKKFFSRHPKTVVRALPRASDIPRRYQMNICSAREARDFLRGVIEKDQRAKYDVFISEQVDARWSGIMISTTQRTIVEISRASLEKLSHGEVIPFANGVFEPEIRRMKYSTSDKSARTAIWNTLQYIRHDQPTEGALPHIAFTPGYFEFMVRRNGRPVFADFKEAPGYLK